MIGIVFDTLSLQGNGIYTTETPDFYAAPKLTIQDERLAQADGAVEVRTSFEPKVFTLAGYMTADTISGLDSLIDTFKLGLNKRKQNLDIDYAGGTRRYTATPRNIIISREKGLNSAGWSAEFFCADPVGSDTTASTFLSSTNYTSSSLNIPPYNGIGGSYQAEPLIVVTLTAVTGGTSNKSLTISNGETLRGVTVTRNWTAGDILEIDCLNKTLYVNDQVVAFSGQFPTWDPGNGAVAYVDDFTTRTVNISGTYTQRWL